MGKLLNRKLPFCLWTANTIRAVLEKERGLRLSESVVCRLLGQLGLSPQRPFYKSYKQDPGKVKAYLAETYPEASSSEFLWISCVLTRQLEYNLPSLHKLCISRVCPDKRRGLTPWLVLFRKVLIRKPLNKSKCLLLTHDSSDSSHENCCLFTNTKAFRRCLHESYHDQFHLADSRGMCYPGEHQSSRHPDRISTELSECPLGGSAI